MIFDDPMKMIFPYVAAPLLRCAALLLVLVLGAACTPDEPDSPPPATELAMAPATGAAPAPSSAPARGDTIDLRKLGYSRGSDEAGLTVYEFSDFGCPFCGIFARSTYPALHEEFVATGRVRWVYVPFVMGMFPNGAESARAAECAAEQERFWEMHDMLFERQEDWKRARNPTSLYRAMARDAGLDLGRFDGCYRQGGRDDRIATNNRAADALRLRVTPSFIVGGRVVEGALPVEQFRMLLEVMTREGT